MCSVPVLYAHIIISLTYLCNRRNRLNYTPMHTYTFNVHINAVAKTPHVLMGREPAIPRNEYLI